MVFLAAAHGAECHSSVLVHLKNQQDNINTCIYTACLNQPDEIKKIINKEGNTMSRLAYVVWATITSINYFMDCLPF